MKTNAPSADAGQSNAPDRYSENGSAEIARLEALGVADLTLAAWRKLGGCGLSDRSERSISRAAEAPFSHWESRLTLREIATAYPLAGRELARYGEEHSDQWIECGHVAVRTQSEVEAWKVANCLASEIQRGLTDPNQQFGKVRGVRWRLLSRAERAAANS